MRQANRFERGSGCFTCESCTRKTRATGGDNDDLKVCAECYEINGIINQISDAAPTGEELVNLQDEIKRLQEVIVSKGGKL